MARRPVKTVKPFPPLPSRITVEGMDRAPHRAFLRGLGLTEDDIAKPFVAVASTDGRVTPCNAKLGELAREACVAVREWGGTPFDFASISVADSMSMGHTGMKFSLPSREIIADGIEAVCRGHAYDALVAFAGCDKTLPGMMMAMVRLNLPSVFMYGGSASPGRWKGRDVTVLDTFEARRCRDGGRHAAVGARPARARLPADTGILPGPVHRQHHGHGVGDPGPRATGLGHHAGDGQRTRRDRARSRPRGDGTPEATAARCRANW